MCKELGRLCQGFGETEGTDTMRFLDLEGIKNTPKDRVVTYARIVVDYRPQKKDPNRVRITAGGNLIQYPGELTTRTSGLRTSKIMWNSTISTRGARYMTADAGNFYLETPHGEKGVLKNSNHTHPPRIHGYVQATREGKKWVRILRNCTRYVRFIPSRNPCEQVTYLRND